MGLENRIIIIIIIIIITLFESQIILAEHECCTNWGDCKSNKSNQIKKSNQELHNEGKYHSKNQGIHGRYYIRGLKERGFLANLSNCTK